MRTLGLCVALATLALLQAGCAVGFRAGGDRGGVDAGVGIGPVNPPVVAPYSDTIPPR
jgi:hypothetical protein